MRYQTQLIKSPRHRTDELRHKNGNTADIIETVLYADNKSAYYTTAFAPTLKGAKIIDTCRNIWEFVKSQIPYVLDKQGYQWVKSPGRLWAEKAGDCKSFSVFVGSCLQNLGIPFGFRFTSYKPGSRTATHVYVYVPHQGGEIIIDAVWDGPFNTEKNYCFKQDIMSEVHYLGEADGMGRMSKNKKRSLAHHLLFPSPSAQIFRKVFGRKKRRGGPQLIPLPFPQGGAVPVPAMVYTAPIPSPEPMPAMPAPPPPVLISPAMDVLQTPVLPIVPATPVQPAQPHFVMTGNNDYTELVLPKDVDQLLDGELDLLLTRQRLAIEKANSARVGGPFNFQQDNYDAAIKVVNKALANLHNPDVINGMGQALENHADSIGKNKSAGKFFKKVGAGLKKGLKAVAKVATAPQRLALKGIMEIYLPKAAYLFLYLFADAKALLPDVMKRKQAKAEKFKKFIVNAVGMKEAHFMGIIRNSLTKKLGKSPESYLADALKARVSGIGAATKKSAARKSPKNKAHPKNKVQAKKKKATKGSGKKDTSGSGRSKFLNIDPAKLEQYARSREQDDNSDESGNGFDPYSKHNPTPVRQGKGILSEENVEAGRDFVKNLGGGNWIGAIITAAMWIIKKVVGLFKKKRGGEDDPGSFTKDDMPDLEKDAANVFEYKDMHEDFSNVPEVQQEHIKQVATDLMMQKADPKTIEVKLQVEAPYLTPKQRAEVKYEIEEGPEAIDENEAAELARAIKNNGRDLTNADKNGGGSAGTGLCHC